MSTAQYEIASIASGGDGVARHEGLVIFTPRTAPGDLVTAEVRVEGRVGRGRLRTLDQPGSTRVEPRCVHYAPPDRCGGCQLQHVDLSVQRESKRLMVRDAFQRIAKRSVPVPEIVAGEGWRYRRTLTLAIRRDGSRIWAGLRAYDDPEAVFDLRECHITEPRILGAWREIIAAGSFLPDAPRLRGTVRWLDERPQFVLEGGAEWSTIAEFLDAVPSLAAIWWQGDGRRRRLVADRRPAGVPGASFLQVNEEIAALMQAHVIRLVSSHGPRTVVDAYSGAGDLAVELAALGMQVAAVELDDEAAGWAASRLALPSRSMVARVEDALPTLLPADLVILNPPRSGVDARALKSLRETPPRAVIYVSCDPATLARDVARLEGWRVESLTCFDMFPQTAHVESVCELVPEAV